MNILIYDGTTLKDTITLDDPASDVEIVTWAVVNTLHNAAVSRSYTTHQKAVRVLSWNGLTKQKVVEMFDLMANQWQYQLWYADPRVNRTQEVYFDGDIELTQDGYDEIFNLSLRMINK